MIWNYSINEIVNGYVEDTECFTCVLCEKTFEKGKIYTIEEQLYDAYGAVRHHIKTRHKSVANYLLQQELSLTGISEVQHEILVALLAGKNDKDITSQLGIAASTVRNHRFKLREKEKQAKLFYALMESLEKETENKIGASDQGMIEEIHETATMVDLRYNITSREREKTIETYMEKDGTLRQFPAKEKKKIILLGEIIKQFERHVEYTEKEINDVLKRIYANDYPTIRRALIEYGFMERTKDCTKYQIKEL